MVCPFVSPQVGLVSFFLPFFPLERRHVRQLFGMALAQRAAELRKVRLGGLTWDAAVIDFLTSRVSWRLVAGFPEFPSGQSVSPHLPNKPSCFAPQA
jgi:hypothetical protein